MRINTLGTTIDQNMTVRMTLITRFNKLTAARPRTPEGLREIESIMYELGKNHWSSVYQDYPRMGAKVNEYKQALISSGEIVSTGNALGNWKVVSKATSSSGNTESQTTTTATTAATSYSQYLWLGLAAVGGIALAIFSPKR